MKLDVTARLGTPDVIVNCAGAGRSIFIEEMKMEDFVVGEPVFVPRPGSRVEDDGVVLSIVFDPQTNGSFLLVLDARDLSERARVHAPQRLPFGFHGDFFPATDQLGSDHRCPRRALPSTACRT
jgi:beta,beta-carotene 9',10'-dioxygenase